MSVSVLSRQNILDRIRAATRCVSKDPQQLPDSYAALRRDYTRRGSLSSTACIELMIERLRDYDAEVIESTKELLPAAITSQLTASGKSTLATPSHLPHSWLAEGFDWIIDRGLTIQQIEAVQGVVTAAFCGVADSGTIVLHHSLTEGRRALTLLPDWHLCILHTSQVVETFPEYFDRYHHPPGLTTWISGPSATADIEMTRIKGVHGPRFLHVILVHDHGPERNLN
jgi:L-lactate dehydrogenase complex protein LldG